MYRSIDRYNADPGGQATFYSGHKITVLISLFALVQVYLQVYLQVIRKKIQKIIFFFLRSYFSML